MNPSAVPFMPKWSNGGALSPQIGDNTRKEGVISIESKNLTPLDMLELIFPDFDRELLLQILEDNQFDIPNTVSSILKVTDEQDAMMFSDNPWSNSPRLQEFEERSSGATNQTPSNPVAMTATTKKEDAPVCKYFIKGSCLIRNCPFKHTTQVACKFFLQGFCMRGTQCDFIHTYDMTSVNEVFANISLERSNEYRERSSSNSNPTFSTNDLSSFPSLEPVNNAKQKKGSAKKSSPDRKSNPNANQSLPKVDTQPSVQQPQYNLASKLKLTQLHEKFSNIPKEIVTQTFISTEYNFEQTSQTLMDVYGSLSPSFEEEQLSYGGLQTAEKKKAIFTSVPKLWVETGEQMAKLYEEYRAEAIEHALMRNKYFSIATSSYLKGDGATAREFSRKGRFHQQKMKELHAKASEQIFQYRNKRLELTNGATIDLHGLHVSEAINLLEQYMTTLTGVKYFYILTGTGHHSFDSRAHLLPAVRTLLDEMG